MKALRNEGFVICEPEKPNRFRKKIMISWICNLRLEIF